MGFPSIISLFLLAFVHIAQAAPQPATDASLDGQTSSRSIFCNSDAPWLCPRAGKVTTSVTTSFGVAQGVTDGSAVRFAVKYANAERWRDSEVVSTWELPNGSTDVTAMPLACPQDYIDSNYSEDCLSMVLYVPTTTFLTKKLPVLAWIHGGSFYLGSSNDPGLDGSKLAVATDSIVAVIQYRLGALGFMAPDGNTNLAVKDVMNALSFLRTATASFGGHPSKITLAGQSSGANMIRALLAVPPASSLFHSAILQSDPMNYGFLSSSTQGTLQGYFNSAISCGADPSCWSSLSIEDILSAQGDLIDSALALDASTGGAQPIRPVRDNSLITSPLDSTDTFPDVDKPILVTTVKNEAAATIYDMFNSSLPSEYFALAANQSLGEERTKILLESPYYPTPDGETDARPRIEQFGTDQIWRCPAWTFARNWAGHGGKAYVGEFTLGQVYEGNGIDICYQDGYVCHQADIEIVFGTVDGPTRAQTALIKEVQKRYQSFLHDGNPNARGLKSWKSARTGDVRPLNLGGTDKIEVGACEPAFWGAAVPYDYQVYGI